MLRAFLFGLVCISLQNVDNERVDAEEPCRSFRELKMFSADEAHEAIAATTFKHLGIDTAAHWTDKVGRPINLVQNNGKPIAELF